MCHENGEKTGAKHTLMETCVGHAETTPRRTNSNTKLLLQHNRSRVHDTVLSVGPEGLVGSALVALEIFKAGLGHATRQVVTMTEVPLWISQCLKQYLLSSLAQGSAPQLKDQMNCLVQMQTDANLQAVLSKAPS